MSTALLETFPAPAWRPIWQDAPARLPAGQRLYAIGDIHGCLDQLTELHRFIAADLAARPTASAQLIHLGDIIDRGPDSAGCIEAILRFTACPTVTLMGNHEDSAVAALAGHGYACNDWMAGGGRTALASWGVDSHSPRESWAAGVPAAHRAFMESLPLFHQVGPYLFIHAGLRPGLPILSQLRDDLLRIRRAFLDSEDDHGAVIVHGHTPTRDRRPEIRPNRINLDTGAVFEGGRLTCAIFEDARLGIAQS